MEETKEKILEYLREVKKKVKLLEIEQNIGIEEHASEYVLEILHKLEEDGEIVKCKKGKYVLTEYSGYISGKIQGNERGYAFFRPDNKDLQDMFISEYDLGGALDKDTVLVKEIPFSGYGNKKECIVIKIIKDANETIIGTTIKRGSRFFVVPDNKRIPDIITITGGKLEEAKHNQKVIVEITKRKLNPFHDVIEGEITDILGDKNEKGIDILSIAKTYGLEQEFPDDVLKECESIGDFVDPNTIKNRVDLRNLRMVTIDGEDAKDLDDAVSIEILDNGNYRLGVHIADVSAYVKEGSFLDKEALKRGTSVYLIDRVIPMLPKKLSNGICSLNPNVDRLAFSVMMEIDKNGGVVNHDIFESVININERMTYTNVYKILEQDDKQLKERYKEVVDDFYKMRELAKILSFKRAKRGAIDFKFGESKITLNENGKPVDVCEYEITVANKIIEEFMLVCNETVAEHFYWLNVPFVYRIHEEPNSEKILSLAQFVKNLGYKLKVSQRVHPKALQQVLEDIDGKKEERIISTVMLRSMQKAKYTTQNKGHFGLAAKYYSHFTSPIRRYPDLIIHRIMKEFINNKFDEKRRKYYEENLEDIAKRCSECERIAQDAEREVEDIKKCEYMSQYIGYVFDGIISSVTSFGMFVELPNTIEGLVRISSMEDDYYNFDESSYSLIGEWTGKKYHIGDEVKVIVARADKEAKQIDFMLTKKKPTVRKKAVFKSKQEIVNKQNKKQRKKKINKRNSVRKR